MRRSWIAPVFLFGLLVGGCGSSSKPIPGLNDAGAGGGGAGTGGGAGASGGAGAAGSGGGGASGGGVDAGAADSSQDRAEVASNDGGGDARDTRGDATGADTGGARCTLPFDPGPCNAAFRVFAFVDGACVQRTYGGCGGNDNRFDTLEECLLVCEDRPTQRACPDGRGSANVCLACGFAGGCRKMATVCALKCTTSAECGVGAGFSCFQGFCEAAFCV